MKSRILVGPLLATLGLVLLVGPPVRAEVFVLKSSSSVTGELLNPDQSPRGELRDQTAWRRADHARSRPGRRSA